MTTYLHKLRGALLVFGLDLTRLAYSILGPPSYLADRRTLKRQQSESSESFPFGRPCPCLADPHMESGSASGHYFHQDLLVARRICTNNPTVHVDVGSRVDGFVAHVASFREIRVLDIRPLPQQIPNIEFLQADLMQTPDSNRRDFCDSLSCLHTLEHFGLGRYGDPINFHGHLTGFDNLTLMLKRQGRLYFSVPIGPQRLEFNAHRVFSIAYLLKMFEGRFEVSQFSYVDDEGDLHEDALLAPDEIENNFGCTYGCGIFELIKQ